MYIDNEVKRELERGSIVIKIELDPNEVATTRRPPAFFVCFFPFCHFR